MSSQAELLPSSPTIVGLAEPRPELRSIPGGPLEVVKQNREAFVNALVDTGLMSAEYADSGALEAFGYWIQHKPPSDSLIHILVGDHLGGAHHLRTIMELGIEGRTMASQVGNKRVRQEQRLRDNRAYRPSIVMIADATTGSLKQWGSTQFPDEWDAERVARALIEVASGQPQKVDEERHSHFKVGIIDGVRIQVATDDKTGKIITGSPRLS